MKEVHLFDESAIEVPPAFAGRMPLYSSLSFSRDQRVLAGIAEHGRILGLAFWEADGGRLTKWVDGVGCYDWLDGSLVIGVGEDVRVYSVEDEIRSGSVRDEHTPAGCSIQHIAASPSGAWAVTSRYSGQGEWGYDVLKIERHGAFFDLVEAGGDKERSGYMSGVPVFSNDESFVVGCFGAWLHGGWWSSKADAPFSTPSEGGDVSVGTLFVDHLGSNHYHEHDMRVRLPSGWLPEDPESSRWNVLRRLEPTADGIRFVGPGGITQELSEPFPEAIYLSTPSTEGRGGLVG